MKAFAAGLVLAGRLGLAAAARADDPTPRGPEFAGWPDSWVNAYRRFDEFIAARRATWPQSELEIGEDGSITHSVRIFKSRTEHLTLNVFRRGRKILGMSDSGQIFGEGRPNLLTPGNYAACLWASTEMGYQYVYPILWFDITDAPRQAEGFASRRSVKKLASPEMGDEVWPSERQLLYLDFQIFPHGNPLDIQTRNRKVNPSIVLRLGLDGKVRRDLLDAAAEKFLQWRIYRDGKLVDKGSADGIAEKSTDTGIGTYSVWVGIDGPSGFMPVSNLLHYPLFPDVSGKNIVVPSETHRKGVPDFLEALSMKGQAQGEVARSGGDKASGNDGSPKSAVGDKEPPSRTQRDLVELWNSWSYDIRNRLPLSSRAE